MGMQPIQERCIDADAQCKRSLMRKTTIQFLIGPLDFNAPFSKYCECMLEEVCTAVWWRGFCQFVASIKPYCGASDVKRG